MFGAFAMSLCLALIPLHSADEHFLQAAVRNEAQVVALSLLALKKNSSPTVHAIAADLVAHHDKIGRGLDDMLQKSAVKIPTTGYVRESTRLEQLAALSPKDFGGVAMREMRGLLDERERLFRSAAKRHGNLELRTLSRELVPLVSHDAERVRAQTQ